MSGPAPLFCFIQVELPWLAGPPDGRYLVRARGSAAMPEAEAPGHEPEDRPATHVIVISTLAAPQRRRLSARRSRTAAPHPGPSPVAVARVTVIDADAVADPGAAERWLRDAGEVELQAALHVLNRALHAFRLASGDPHLHPVGRRHAIVARAGFGEGEKVADGDWTEAVELPAEREPRRRRRALVPQARLAAALSGRVAPLACEELALRARLDLDEGRPREAAVQLLAALDAALTELPADPAAAAAGRVAELGGLRDGVARVAREALASSAGGGPPSSGVGDALAERLAVPLARLESALRARWAGLG